MDNRICMIYKTYTSNNQRKRALQELEHVHHAQHAAAWTDTPITFNEEDQPKVSITRVSTALVLGPIVDGF
jgi:hypothetical protein